MNRNPLVSIILPVFNAEKYVKFSIESILSQTYDNFELIVVDDSDDNTTRIIEMFDSNKIKHYRTNNKNISKQLNYGISKAKGLLIARMDADDICHPQRISEQVSFLTNNNNFDLIGTNFSFINEAGDYVMRRKLPENQNEIEFWMPVLSTILHSTILTYKKIFEDIGGYDENISRAEDIDLFFKLFQKGYCAHNIQKFLYFYRIYKNDLNKVKKTEGIYKGLSFYYINQKYENKSKIFEWEKYFLMGAHEYYNGSIESAQKYLLKSFFKKPYSFKVLKFLLPLLLFGNKINYLRKNLYLKKMVYLTKKVLRIKTIGI